MFGAVVSQVKALDKAISGKATGSSQKVLDVDDTSPIALLALESPPAQPYRTPRRHKPLCRPTYHPVQPRPAWTKNVVLPCRSIDALGVVVLRFPRKVAVVGCVGLLADVGKAVPLLHKLVSLSSINVPQLVCCYSANLPSPAHIRS